MTRIDAVNLTMLRINGTEASDAGEYVCEVEYGSVFSIVQLRLIVNDPKSVTKENTVQIPPGLIVQTVTAKEKTQTQLECFSESIPEDKNKIDVIRWFKVSEQCLHSTQ